MRTAKMSTIGVPRFINTVRQERVNLGGGEGARRNSKDGLKRRMRDGCK